MLKQTSLMKNEGKEEEILRLPPFLTNQEIKKCFFYTNNEEETHNNKIKKIDTQGAGIKMRLLMCT